MQGRAAGTRRGGRSSGSREGSQQSGGCPREREKIHPVASGVTMLEGGGGGGGNSDTCHPLAFRHIYTMILGDMYSHVLSY